MNEEMWKIHDKMLNKIICKIFGHKVTLRLPLHKRNICYCILHCERCGLATEVTQIKYGKNGGEYIYDINTNRKYSSWKVMK